MTHASLPFVTIFTITFNQRDIVLQTIADIFRLDYPHSQLALVVLDDGSTDGSTSALLECLRNAPISMTVISEQHESDYQSARRWNQCIGVARQETEVFIQVDDVRIRPDFVKQHVKWHMDDILRIVSGAKFEGSEETWHLSDCRRSVLTDVDGGARRNVAATAIWGCSLSYHRSAFDITCKDRLERPYDEAMKGYGHHEVEFAWRVQKAGGETIYDPAAGVFHKDHTSQSEHSRGLDRSFLVEQGLQANATYICKKHNLDALPRW